MLAGNGFGITGAASTVVRDNLTKNFVLVSNDKGKIAASSVPVSSIQDIVDLNLTPNKAVISDANGKVSTSSVSSIEVGHLVGVNDSIQNQLDSKANQATTYTNTEIDTNLYTRTVIDALLTHKADYADVYERSLLYTRLETNNLLNTKQDNLATDSTNDTTTHAILNGHIVKILEEGTNINIESHGTKLVIKLNNKPR